MTVLVLDIAADPVVVIAARACHRRTRDSTSSRTTGATTALRASAGRARLSLAIADVLLDGFGRLPFERGNGLGRGAKAKYRENRRAGENELFHKNSTGINDP
ncbi:hypothetical protein D9M73_197590 [compost metagenome]